MNEDNKDALNNLINSIQEKMGTQNSVESNETSDNQTPSFDFSTLLNNFSTNNTNNNNSGNSNTTSQGSSIDPSILLKVQQLMGAMNSNNPQKNLLLSLKPFLRKSRQDKMSEYITILNVISILESFRGKNKGSE